MEKIRTIIDKEWAEVFKNKLVLGSVIFLPLILTALPLIILATTSQLGVEELASASTSAPDEFFGEVCTGLNEFDCTQYYLLTTFITLFLIMPIMIPVSIAAYSIVGEKTTRSLEPLLATPISTGELLIGKMLAAIIPAVIVTWSAFALFLIGVRFMTSSAVFQRVLDPTWLAAIIIIGPMLSFLAVNIAIMISSRVTDPRVAEQLSGAVVLPIVLLMVAQVSGLFIIDLQLVWASGFVILVIDVILAYFGQQIFEREKILTRWK